VVLDIQVMKAPRRLRRLLVPLAGGLTVALLQAPAMAQARRDRLDLPWDLPDLGILGVDDERPLPGRASTMLREPQLSYTRLPQGDELIDDDIRFNEGVRRVLPANVEIFLLPFAFLP
jgi:hypothetical protein